MDNSVILPQVLPSRILFGGLGRYTTIGTIRSNSNSSLWLARFDLWSVTMVLNVLVLLVLIWCILLNRFTHKVTFIPWWFVISSLWNNFSVDLIWILSIRRHHWWKLIRMNHCTNTLILKADAVLRQSKVAKLFLAWLLVLLWRHLVLFSSWFSMIRLWALT